MTRIWYIWLSLELRRTRERGAWMVHCAFRLQIGVLGIATGVYHGLRHHANISACLHMSILRINTSFFTSRPDHRNTREIAGYTSVSERLATLADSAS